MLNWINFIVICALWLSPYPALGFLYLVIWIESYKATSRTTVEDFWQQSSIPESIFDVRKAMYQLGRSQQNNQAINKYWRHTLPKIAQRRLAADRLLRQLSIDSSEESAQTPEEEKIVVEEGTAASDYQTALGFLKNNQARYQMTKRGLQQQSLNDLEFQNPLYRQVQRVL